MPVKEFDVHTRERSLRGFKYQVFTRRMFYKEGLVCIPLDLNRHFHYGNLRGADQD